MSRHKVILRNVFSNWVGFFVEACFAFFLSPFVIHTLGDTAYGLWVLLISLTGYFGLLNLGLRPAINKYVSEFAAKEEMDRLNEIVNAALYVYSSVGVVILLGSIGLSFCLDWFPFLPADLARANRWVVIILGLQLALNLPAVVFGGILSGLQRYDIHNAIGISATLARSILILLILRQHPTLLTLALITLGTTGGSYLLTIWAARRQCPSLHLKFVKPAVETILLLFRYSSVIVLINVGGRLIHYANSFIVAGLVSVAAVTHFAIATNIINYLRTLVQESVNVLNPAASEMKAQNREDELRTLLLYTTKASLVLVFPIVLGCIFLGREFIVLWMGPNYAGSATILAILAGAEVAVLAQSGTRAILYGLNRHQILARLTLLQAVISIGLSVVLGRVWGLAGIALGSAIASVTVGAIWLPRWICQEMGISVAAYLRQAYLPPLLPAIPMALLLFWMVRISPPYSWLHLITKVLIAGSVYGLAAFFFCLESWERSKIYALLRRIALFRSAEA